MKGVATHLAAGLLLLAGLIALPAEGGMQTSGLFVEFTATRNQERPPATLETKQICPDFAGTHTFAPAFRVEDSDEVVITDKFLGFEFSLAMTRSGTQPRLEKVARVRVTRFGIRPLPGEKLRINFNLHRGDCVRLVFTPETDLVLLSGDVVTVSLFLIKEPQPPQSRVEAFIDGRSVLTLRGDTAQWHHYDYAAPGLHEGHNERTIINGVSWYPVWPDTGDPERRDCDCDSDVLTGVVPPVPTQEVFVSLTEIAVRDQVAVIEHPSAANGFAMVIEFDDNNSDAAEWYVVDIHLQAEP